MKKFTFSFKLKTILGIATIEMFFLLVLVLNSRSILYETVESEVQLRAKNIASLLSTASVDAVVSEDLATLESISETAMSIDNIMYLKIIGLEGVLAEKGNPELLDKVFSEDLTISESESDGVYDTYSQILVDGYSFGRVEIGLSIKRQKAIVGQATNHLTLIAIIELIFVALFSLLLGFALTKRLVLLKEAAVKISKGESGLQIPIKGNDEVSDVSIAFNLMSTKVDEITKALQSDNTRMDAVMNTVTDGIFMIGVDGKIYSMNRAAYILFDCGSYGGELNIFDFIPEFFINKTPIPKEKNIQRLDGKTKDGKRVSLEVHSRSMMLNKRNYVVGVIRDLTFINSLQDELKAVFDISKNGFLIVSKDKKISYVNTAFYSLFSIPKGTCDLGENDWECFTGVVNKSIDFDKHVNLDLLEDIGKENTLYLKKPVEKILTVYRQKIDQKDGSSSDILFFVDVTHITIVDKMKNEFLSTAAHELRTPLASICGFSELLLDRDYDKNASKEMLEIIYRQSLNLKHLIDELLDLSRIEARLGQDFNMQLGSVENVIKESCQQVEGAFNGRRVKVKAISKWPTLSFDEDKMRQVFINILSNSFKYSPNDSDVILAFYEREKEGETQFGISVIDNGIGMLPDELARIGERFYRADESGSTPGSGLGISLVKEIISIHSGEVAFISEKGKGMAATIWLPVIKDSGSEE